MSKCWLEALSLQELGKFGNISICFSFEEMQEIKHQWSWAAAHEPYLCLKKILGIYLFFSLRLPALLLTLFGKHPLREQKSPVKIIDPASHCEETEIQGIYSWIERRCILEWNTCCFLTPHSCLLRSDFVKGEDKVSLIWVEVMWPVWYLCHWKVKVCLGIKSSVKDF